ncbi:MAG: DUF2851 family protein [Flavobacteriales bacterium]|nr:DUF2851 family protein [Flavobacteriales bacterium]
MKEDYLHYIWKFQKFNPSYLKTSENETIIIKKTGYHNANAGPDFLESNLIIGDTEWFGNIEIHVKASDWNKHQHQNDKAYNNVILHVVFENDLLIKNENGEKIPTLILNSILDPKHFLQYKHFINNGLSIPCQRQINTIDPFITNSWLERLAINRLAQKTHLIRKKLNQYKGDWNQTLIHFLMRYFGMKVNGDAMADLSTKTPLLYINKERYNLLNLEALLFGQAGMLNTSEIKAPYFLSLRKEYLFIKQKYQLNSMKLTNWKYSKLRPPNFPTIRIAQLAQLLYLNHELFEHIRAFASVETYTKLLKVTPSSFWSTHYTFKKESKTTKSTVGKMFIHHLIINVISPISFTYGKSINDERYCNYATELTTNLPAESNAIIQNWENIGLLAKSAMQSQSLIELYANYCQRKECLNCAIGIQILR